MRALLVTFGLVWTTSLLLVLSAGSVFMLGLWYKYVNHIRKMNLSSLLAIVVFGGLAIYSLINLVGLWLFAALPRLNLPLWQDVLLTVLAIALAIGFYASCARLGGKGLKVESA